jgi:hypothetical protein
VDEQATTARIAFSNAVRLNTRQCVGLLFFAAMVVMLVPRLWNALEPLTVEPDSRIPHELSQDYWLYERYAGLAVENFDAVIVGDSVVWGEYVLPEETLSHYLNERSRTPRGFANLGLGAAHPLALAGVLEHYAGSIAHKSVVLQCNPLWLSSPKADLQDEKFTAFNHPRVVPQFWPPIPAYPVPWFPANPDDKQQISERLGILVEQRVPFSKWTNHLQQAYYGQSDIPAWTLNHPYENPLEPLTRGLPPLDRTRRYAQRPWYKDKTAQDFPWVDMDTSLQWPAFQRAVMLLQGRGNRLFVVVGPLNEHMMTPPSKERYQKVKGTITAWLEEMQVPHLIPGALPSEQYGDASHPLATGYEALARQLLEDPALRSAVAPR